jgi:hypothetical protein
MFIPLFSAVVFVFAECFGLMVVEFVGVLKPAFLIAEMAFLVFNGEFLLLLFAIIFFIGLALEIEFIISIVASAAALALDVSFLVILLSSTLQIIFLFDILLINLMIELGFVFVVELAFEDTVGEDCALFEDAKFEV